MKTMTMAAGALALGLAVSAFAGQASAQTDLPVLHTGAGSYHQGQYLNDGYVHEAGWRHRLPKRRVIRKLRYLGFWDFKRVRSRRHAYVVSARGPRGWPVRVKGSAYSGEILWIKPRRRWSNHHGHHDHWGRHGGGRWN